jgi:hypothetical protein
LIQEQRSHVIASEKKAALPEPIGTGTELFQKVGCKKQHGSIVSAIHIQLVHLFRGNKKYRAGQSRIGFKIHLVRSLAGSDPNYAVEFVSMRFVVLVLFAGMNIAHPFKNEIGLLALQHQWEGINPRGIIERTRFHRP